MKKIILNLFLASALILSTSCSSDDDGGGEVADTASISIDDSSIVFDVIIVQDNVDSRSISLSNSSNTSTILNIVVEKDVVGSDVVNSVTYAISNDSYTYYGTFAVPSDNPQSLTALVEINSESRFKANLSGILTKFDSVSVSYETLEISNGVFDFSY